MDRQKQIEAAIKAKMDEVSAMVAKLHWSYVTYKGFGVDKECQAATEALDRLFSALDNVDSSQV